MLLIFRACAGFQEAYVLLMLMFSVISGNAQSSDSNSRYFMLVDEGQKSYDQKNFAVAAEKFKDAFAIAKRFYHEYDVIRYEAAYNAACSYSLNGKIDSAFAELEEIATTGRLIDYDLLKGDRDLVPLHQDTSRWNGLTRLVRENKRKAEINLDQELVALLKQVREDDQKYRTIYEGLRRRKDSSGGGLEERELVQLMRDRDSLNLDVVSKVLDTRGWLGPDKVGFLGTQTLFLVIQHSRLEVQEKYLPMMRKAVAEGNALSRDFAFLEDRVAIRRGKLQTYGSQTWLDRTNGKIYAQKIADPYRLDSLRASVWLQPMSVYLGQAWDPALYVKTLPELEARISRAGK